MTSRSLNRAPDVTAKPGSWGHLGRDLPDSEDRQSALVGTLGAGQRPASAAASTLSRARTDSRSPALVRFCLFARDGMKRPSPRRLSLGSAVALAVGLAGAGEARATGTVIGPVTLASNAACYAGDVGFACQGLDVDRPVQTHPVQWSAPPDRVEYRFFACPAAAFDEMVCAARSPWQAVPELTYPVGDAGAWAAVQVRGIYAEEPSPVAASNTQQLASRAQINPATSIQITGLLPDGTARPGMTIDARVDVPAGGALFTGTPEPTIYRTWQFERKPFRMFVSPQRPYDGPFVVPEVDELAFVFSARNIIGGNGRRIDIKVRVKPHALQPLPQLRPRQRAVVGQQLRFRASGPAVPAFAAFPTPAVRWQWQRCTVRGCRDIPKATSRVYTAKGRDLGRRLRLTLRAENPEGRARIPVMLAGPVRARRRLDSALLVDRTP